MRKTTLYLPEDLDRALKAKAKRTGVPWPRSIGAGAGGRFAADEDEAILEREWGDSSRP